MLQSDILIVGAGVVGCAVARVLSRYDARITVLEQEDDVAEGASKANSGIVHAGFDAVPGTLKAKLNVEGASMYPDLCRELGVPYGRPGALVLAFDEKDRPTLEKLLAQAKANNVPDCRLLSRAEILALEPNVNPAVVAALHAPTSGLTSPYELTFALADHAAVNGVDFQRDTRVLNVTRTGNMWRVETNRDLYEAKVLVNCAGAWSGKLHNLMGGATLEITHRRGQYWLLDHLDTLPFTMTMFQCPTAMGKGVLVSPTVHGNMLLGPSAEDIADDHDTATTPDGLSYVLDKCRLTWPNVSTRTNITNFSGIRAHEEHGDFIIGSVAGAENAYETVGIESPGLSAAPAIGEMLGSQIAREQKLARKSSYLPPLPHVKPFYAMTDAERAQVVADAPLYGNLVCRCEVVTEAEIRASIRRPVGARSIDGVKRRTRAGMGRCQGGFCSPRVAQILSEELHLPLEQITKCGGESYLLTGTLADALKEAK